MTLHQEEAVSPIMGVLLMVSITVAIGAVLFISLRELDESPNRGVADMAVTSDEVEDRIDFSRAGIGYRLRDFQIRMTAPGDFEFNTDVQPGADAYPTPGDDVYIGGSTGGPPDGPLKGGDFLSLCASPAATNVEVLVKRVDQNDSIVFQKVFRTLRDCPA